VANAGLQRVRATHNADLEEALVEGPTMVDTHYILWYTGRCKGKNRKAPALATGLSSATARFVFSAACASYRPDCFGYTGALVRRLARG